MSSVRASRSDGPKAAADKSTSSACHSRRARTDSTVEVLFPLSSRSQRTPAESGRWFAAEAVTFPTVFEGVFSAPECRRIVDFCRRLELYEGRCADARSDYRRADVASVEICASSIWFYRRVAKLFRAVNNWYRYDLVGLVEALQFIVYRSRGRFDWHLDTGRRPPLSTRKLSLSIQLTDDADYAGGDLEFAGLGALPRSRGVGSVIVFPSFLPHRVTRVVCGTRCALVAWAHGPVFR